MTLNRLFRFMTLVSLFVFHRAVHDVAAQDFGQMIRTSDPLSPEEERKTFRVPDGFEVTLFASEPDIQKPMNMAFDAQGRMWVSGSNDYPFPNLDGDATDSIRVLEDTDGDGRADKFTTFVEGITIPIGLYPYENGVIAFSIPNIVYYRDTDGDGKSDTSKILYGPFDFSRDTHGLNNAFRRGLDGWIYACHGFNNNSKVSGADGNTVTMSSGNTYRFKIDGSRIEHFTHGQVNPFGMTFDQFGDLYTSDCHTKPITLLLRGGYYQSFGKPHDGLGYVPPVMEHLHGSTAIAGLSQQTGPAFPEEYRNSFFVGNVMTSRVHRDVIKHSGSTVSAIEKEDFLVSSDPWFRPVDTQCGPDGALYVADFYNRIIGHYEVPLDHPGRDRYRGRIWRVSYVGDREQKNTLDLTKLDTSELIAELQNENLPTAYRAVEQLVNRIGHAAVPTLLTALKNRESRATHHVLWTLHRLGRLSPQQLQQAMFSEHEIVRIHVQRILEATQTWSAEHLDVASQGLTDKNGLVQRAAAGAFATHPEHVNLKALLRASVESPETDSHLRHAIDIAMKNLLLKSDAYESIQIDEFSDRELRILARVSLAVKTSEAANFLIKVIDRIELSDEAVSMAARFSTQSNSRKLIDMTQAKFADDVDQQLETIVAIEEGMRFRGEKIPDVLTTWGRKLIKEIINDHDPGLTDWKSLPLKSGKRIAWNVEKRNTEDQKYDLAFLSSLPAGERATGVLKSKSFTIPSTLTFYVCGHLGFPDEPAIEENRVSLHLSSNDQEVATVLAPRNDTARKVVWDLTQFQGQEGYLKIVDGIDVRAYAWIAVSGFDPPVVQIPEIDLRDRRQRLITSAQLAGRLGLLEFADEFTSIGLAPKEHGSVRYAALTFVAAVKPHPYSAGLLALFADESVTGTVANRIARLIDDENENKFHSLMKSLPLRLQTTFARTMSQSDSLATKLAELIEQGIVSPEVLRSEVVKAQVSSLTKNSLREKYELLISSLPEDNNQISELIANWKTGFDLNAASISAGNAVFKKNCATCHSIAGEGKKIGPQLDGVGNRGLERVLEDVLAPNRNIDLAFRSRIYALNNGKILSGLFRREEGNLVVIADTKGEEISFSKDQIEAERVSPISIMPENWGEAIPKDDFQNLLGYLLEQQAKAEPGTN